MTKPEPPAREPRAEHHRLLSALRAGDDAAFEVIAAELTPAMLLAARAYAGPDEAEALVREAWEGVLPQIDRLGDPRALRRSLVREVIVRAIARRKSRGCGASRTPVAAPDDALAVLRHAIAQLPPRQRIVIGLRDIEGWSAREVRETLGITAESERTLLRMARRRVHAALVSTSDRRAA